MPFKFCCECGREHREESESPFCPPCEASFDEDDSFDEDYYIEQRENELAERAAMCKCGAWQFAKDGTVIHVADCCCGAE